MKGDAVIGAKPLIFVVTWLFSFRRLRTSRRDSRGKIRNDGGWDRAVIQIRNIGKSEK